MTQSDKLTIEQCEEMCKGKWPNYKVSTTATLRQLADCMRDNEVLLAGWGAIQGTLRDHAVQGHIRGWGIEPIPEAVEAQKLWESYSQAKTSK